MKKIWYRVGFSDDTFTGIVREFREDRAVNRFRNYYENKLQNEGKLPVTENLDTELFWAEPVDNTQMVVLT